MTAYFECTLHPSVIINKKLQLGDSRIINLFCPSNKKMISIKVIEERDYILYHVCMSKMSKINMWIALTCLQSTGTYNTKHSLECHEKINRNHKRRATALPCRIVCKSMHLKVVLL